MPNLDEIIKVATCFGLTVTLQNARSVDSYLSHVRMTLALVNQTSLRRAIMVSWNDKKVEIAASFWNKQARLTVKSKRSNRG